MTNISQNYAIQSMISLMMIKHNSLCDEVLENTKMRVALLLIVCPFFYDSVIAECQLVLLFLL